MYGQIVLEKFCPNLTFNNSMWEYLFFYILNSGYYQSFKIFANLTGFVFFFKYLFPDNRVGWESFHRFTGDYISFLCASSLYSLPIFILYCLSFSNWFVGVPYSMGVNLLSFLTRIRLVNIFVFWVILEWFHQPLLYTCPVFCSGIFMDFHL